MNKKMKIYEAITEFEEGNFKSTVGYAESMKAFKQNTFDGELVKMRDITDKHQVDLEQLQNILSVDLGEVEAGYVVSILRRDNNRSSALPAGRRPKSTPEA